MGEDRTDRPGPTNRRTTVAEAAKILGISAEAVRGRVRRGTLPVEREGGAVYVLVGRAAEDRTTADRSRATDDRPNDRTELVDALREQISDLRGQLAEANAANRENRRIIAGLTQRIPELEATNSSDPPEAPETVEEEPRSAAGGAQEATERRSWWRRMFGT